MKTSILATNFNQVLAQRNLFFTLTVVSLLLNILLGGISYYCIGRERIVVSPPVVNTQFWVSSDTVSDSYLEQMSGFFVGLVLNVSPNNFVARSQPLLQHVDSGSYAVMKAQLIAQHAEIERRAMSTNFHPISYKIDREKLLVEVKGELRIMIGGASMELKSTTYQIQYVQRQGRLFIKRFNEIKNAL